MNFKVENPETTDELLRVIAENRGNNFRFAAGCTDLILELKKQCPENLTIINLARVRDERFTSIQHVGDGIRIGALVTANAITTHRAFIERKQFTVLRKAAMNLASRQIRQVATVGGNLCTASPAGDISCALIALEAQCEILSATGKVRTVPIRKFFTDVRKTALQRDEVLQSVFIPSSDEHRTWRYDFIKVGTRRSMECAIVSLAYLLHTDENGTITYAGVAIGSVAPTIKFVQSACEYLTGKKYSSIGTSESEEFATKVLDYASPISDIRASAWYRKEVLYNISKSIFKNGN